ncbi:MAG: hypothetical protein ACYCTL_09515 [Acidimicrobiales bacterium]
MRRQRRGQRTGLLQRYLDRGGETSVRGTGGELLKLVVEYVKQETLGPLRGLGRFVVFGTMGAVALAAGMLLLVLAFLRLLQDETGSTFTGHLSWLPYLIAAVVAVAAMVIAGWRVIRGAGLPDAGDGRSDFGYTPPSSTRAAKETT